MYEDLKKPTNTHRYLDYNSFITQPTKNKDQSWYTAVYNAIEITANQKKKGRYYTQPSHRALRVCRI